MKKILEKIDTLYNMHDVRLLYDIHFIKRHTFDIPLSVNATKCKQNIYNTNVPPMEANAIESSRFFNVSLEFSP